MEFLSLFFVAVLQPFFVTGARHYSSNTQPLLVVADVCGSNPDEVAQSYRAMCVSCRMCIHTQFCAFGENFEFFYE